MRIWGMGGVSEASFLAAMEVRRETATDGEPFWEIGTPSLFLHKYALPKKFLRNFFINWPKSHTPCQGFVPKREI